MEGVVSPEEPPFMIKVTNQFLPEIVPLAAKELGTHYINIFDALGGNDKSLWDKYSKEFKKVKSDGIHWGYP